MKSCSLWLSVVSRRMNFVVYCFIQTFEFLNIVFLVCKSLKKSTTSGARVVFVLDQTFVYFFKPSFSSLVSLGENAEDDDGEHHPYEQRQTEANSEENPGLSFDHAARL